MSKSKEKKTTRRSEEEMNGSSSFKMKNMKNGKDRQNDQQQTSSSSSSQRQTLFYRVLNLLDFNLKFSSPDVERTYQKCYLPVTRLIFIKYLFYLILFTLSWLVYLVLYRVLPSQSTPLLLDTNCDTSIYDNRTHTTTSNNAVVANTGDNTSGNNSSSSSSSKSTDDLYLFILLPIMALIYLFLFVALLVIEINERSCRNLQQKLEQEETETKVDVKIAEGDLKKAMEKIVEKEDDLAVMRRVLEQRKNAISTLRDVYLKLAYVSALLVVFLMFFLNFVVFAFPASSPISKVAHFVWFCESILLLYVVYPFHMVVSIVVGVALSIAFEVITLRTQFCSLSNSLSNSSLLLSQYIGSEMFIFVFIKILLYTSLHLVGFYLKLSLELVKRDTFVKVADMNQALEFAMQDKELTGRMIQSIMPPLFTHVFGKPEEFKKSVNNMNAMRPLYIYPVHRLSILFADIVGFTRMSSNKTAQELVFLLNDLYGRFDRLCEQTHCEKISTLGDCYYCVSGCLNGRTDHAQCCVEMGLLMVKEIESFNREHGVDVNMRVGVHTGSALCGFIGGKRFRFDVWSSDVTLANKMESTGRAGWVHISDECYSCIESKNKFKIESGEKYAGKPTYFILSESKLETVADALRLNDTNSSNTNTVQSQQQNQQEEALEIDPLMKKREEEENGVARGLEETDEQARRATSGESSDPEAATTTGSAGGNQLSILRRIKEEQFFLPNLNPVTLCFGRREELKYQEYLLGMSSSTTSDTTTNSGNRHRSNIFISAQYGILTSALVSFLVNLCTCTAFLLTFFVSTMTEYEFKMTTKYRVFFGVYLGLFGLFFLIQIALLVLFYWKFSNKQQQQTATTQSQPQAPPTMSSYAQYPPGMMTRGGGHNKTNRTKLIVTFLLIHLLSGIMLILVPTYILINGLPVMSDLILNQTTHQKLINFFSVYFYFCYVISLIHFSSFIQINSLYKSTLAFVLAVACGVISYVGICAINAETQATTILSSSLFIQGFIKENFSILLDLSLLIVLIWLMNVQSELILRLGFKCDQEAQLRVKNSREQKELANWLIEVVLPAHVMGHIKERRQYSRNYDHVGVLFVSLCNFSEFFEEAYEGGRELLRVLNEITIDFDRMFDEPRYKNIEKIKSIGSTYMIASGLCPNEDDPDSGDNNNVGDGTIKQHLYDLVDFALELYEKLESFNNEAMSVCHFKFQMRMGLNYGPVTAGVIGTERLLYDIWGDTVNVASRMDSTGQSGFIQAPDKVAQALGGKYTFVERGVMQIKGKDQMTTYVMNPKENVKSTDAEDNKNNTSGGGGYVSPF